LDPALDVSQYAHTVWKIRDGFIKGEIASIAQTPDGYLWLGTEFGLVRFDGVRAVPWQPSAGEQLPSNRVLKLLVTRDGALWIGTLKGLASWKDGKLTQYPKLAGQSVNSLVEDREGTVWAGVLFPPPGRLCSIQRGSVRCHGEDGTLGSTVLGLYADTKGNLWVGVQNGLWRWKPGSPQFYSLPGEPNGIQGLSEDADGALLISLRGGVRRFADGKAVMAYPYPGPDRQLQARRLLRGSRGSLWIGTLGRGLMHVHEGRTDVFSPSDGLSDENVTALFEDREGNFWVATEGGLDRFHDSAVTTFSVKQGLSSANVGSVLADRDGSVWLATFGGLNRWKDRQITIFGGRDGKLNGDAPDSLFQDSRGRIWVSTYRGFGYLENNRFIPIKAVPGGSVHGIAGDTEGNLWIANQEVGLFQLVQGNLVQEIPWAKFGHTDYVWSLAADPLQGGVWIGFYGGGVAYFRDGQVRASYAAPDGPGDHLVHDFGFSPDGAVWEATESGLSRLKNGRVVTLTSKNGLPCDAVHWVMQDDDHAFWLNTTCGLVRIVGSEVDAWATAADKDTNTKQIVQTTVFDSSDGVRSQSLSGGYRPQVARSSDGKLWFAGLDGISVIDPRHLPFNKLPPPVHIEQITADRTTYDPASYGNGRMPLPAQIRDLQIDYTALSLAVPEKVHFRYKLEGRDRDWQDAGNRRQAFYTDLPPRNYRFRVKACNNSGVWNEEGAFLDFSVAPAYYHTAWFRLACVAAFLALLWGLYQFLQSNERKLRRIINTMPTLAWSAAPDGPVDFVNQRWLDYTGLSPEQGRGWGWTVAVHRDDLNRLAEYWRLIMRTGEPGEIEARFRRFDGEYRWFLFRANPVRDGSGKTVKWYGTNTDIDDRKRAEATLGASEAELRRAYAQATEAQRLSQTGSFTWDVQADDHVWSEEIYRIFGFEPGTKVTMEMIQSVIHPDDRPEVEAVIRRAAEGADFDLAFRIVTASGAVRHLHVVGHRIEQIADRPVLLGAIQDVTESKLAEESLNRARSELARVTRVTTLNALTASIAHEVNQPLSGIVTNASTCRRMLDADPPNVEGARETARRIVRDGNRASDVVVRLRALFSNKEFRLEPMDLNEATGEVIALSLSDLQRNRVILTSELADGLPLVTGDRIQLQQVIFNLVRNASDAMGAVDDRPRELLIKTEREGLDRVRLSVKDMGHGFPPEAADKLFQAFYTTKNDGMGIGLHISQSIIEAHNGRLWATLNDGPGAIFQFTLPIEAKVSTTSGG
jgi:PAS domain S-box-containing protein